MKFALALSAALLILLAGCCSIPSGIEGGPGDTGGTQGSGGGQGTGTGGGGSGTSGTSLAECLTICTTSYSGDLLNSCKSACHISDAENAMDPNKCDPILQLANNNNEYFACIAIVAEDMGSTAPCSKLTDSAMKDTCIMNVAQSTGDFSKCAEIANPDMKTACMSS